MGTEDNTVYVVLENYFIMYSTTNWFTGVLVRVSMNERERGRETVGVWSEPQYYLISLEHVW